MSEYITVTKEVATTVEVDVEIKVEDLYHELTSEQLEKLTGLQRTGGIYGLEKEIDLAWIECLNMELPYYLRQLLLELTGKEFGLPATRKGETICG